MFIAISTVSEKRQEKLCFPDTNVRIKSEVVISMV